MGWLHAYSGLPWFVSLAMDFTTFCQALWQYHRCNQDPRVRTCFIPWRFSTHWFPQDQTEGFGGWQPQSTRKCHQTWDDADVPNGGIEISIRLVWGITADQYEWSERAGLLAKGSAGVTTPWEMSRMNEGGFLEASWVESGRLSTRRGRGTEQDVFIRSLHIAFDTLLLLGN